MKTPDVDEEAKYFCVEHIWKGTLNRASFIEYANAIEYATKFHSFVQPLYKSETFVKEVNENSITITTDTSMADACKE